MKANNLKYTATKTGINYEGTKADIIINIRLNDECKNGHQDFSITGTIYEHGKRSDSAFLAGGCIHEEIEKHFPEFTPFVRLHLCDYKGIPMYAVENGFYHLKNGFNSKLTVEAFKAEFCEYYRITPEQFDVISGAENKLEYAIFLKELNILSRWKEEADKAIKQLEELTGLEFLCDSVKSQYAEPKPEEVESFRKLKAEGFYTPEQKAIRAKEERDELRRKRFRDIEVHLQKVITNETQEAKIKTFVLKRIDKLFEKKKIEIDFSFDNFIYYNHSNRVKFNWTDLSHYKVMTEADFLVFCESLTESDFQTELPKGISFECSGKVYSV